MSLFYIEDGVDSETVNVVIDNEKEVTTKIWDTAGQEKFQAVFKSHYQKADGIILIYSVEIWETYDKIQEWMNSIQLTQLYIFGVTIINII